MDFSLKKAIFIIVFVFLAANVLILDIILSKPKDNPEIKNTQKDIATEKQSNTTCDENCRDYTDTQISKLEAKIAPQQAQVNTVEEIYIPLGSGTTQAGDWQVLPGIQTQVDTAKYPGITNATFEVTVNIPNGNQQVWVQLYDSTNNHPVWFSDVTYQGGTVAHLTSSPISLSSGNITYQVRAKTQLQDTLNIESSRLHLILK